MSAFNSSLLGLFNAAPAVSALDYIQQLHGQAWFRLVYARDGWPVLRSRSARVDSGLIISSDPSLGGLIACPFESIVPNRSPAPLRRIATYVAQARNTGLAGISGLPLTAWGPLLLTDLRSDDPFNVYAQPTTDPATGLVGGDPQTYSQTVYLWTADAPQSVQDLDPVFVELQRRADTHWMQQTLGDHHRIELTVDSAVALAECGTELYVYWPERFYAGMYQIISMSQPLSAGPQTWRCQFISRRGAA